MKRKLFCQLSPTTYKISVFKQIACRTIVDVSSGSNFAKDRANEKLPICLYRHNSLIRRKLGNVDMKLQNNKAVNILLATDKLNGILIKPGEVFSFWKLVGPTTEKLGYKEGLTISQGKPFSGIGGGLCPLTNCIHWLVVYREVIDKSTGNTIDSQVIRNNHAVVMYDTSSLTIIEK